MLQYELPIKIDVLYPCAKCGMEVVHECTVYKDIEYRKCQRCHARTTWDPVSKKILECVNVQVEDRTREDWDNHRRFPRRKNRPGGGRKRK